MNGSSSTRRLTLSNANVRARVRSLRSYAIVFSVLALFVTLSFASEAFFSERNLFNIMEQSAPVGIIACSATLVIIAGNFDLSVGAILAITGVFAALIAQDTSPVIGLLAAPLIGLTIGIGNGVLVTVFRINSFMATLASSYMIRGAAALITGGFLVVVEESTFGVLGRESPISLGYSAIVFLAFALSTQIVLARTTFGRYMYAAGGNSEAARLSGVRVRSVQTATYALSGMSAGLAGMIDASRVSTGQADAGMGIEFTAIAAVVIGGTSIFGGEGAVWRSVLGVFLLAFIQNGFNILNVNPLYQQIVLGAIILSAVALDAVSRER